jgi:hypothetical protein
VLNFKKFSNVVHRYPNPALDVIKLRNDTELRYEQINLSLLDAQGRLIRVEQLKKPNTSQGLIRVTTSDLSSGTDFLEIEMGSQIIREKVMVY